MRTLSPLRIRGPILFEAALRDADTTQLGAMLQEISAREPGSSGHWRKRMLEAEFARRKSADATPIFTFVS